MRFHFDPKVVSALKKYNFKIFNLANNHSLDQGAQGWQDTVDILKRNQLYYFGRQDNALQYAHTYILEGSRKIRFVGINLITHSIDRQRLAELIKSFPEADFVVVFAHWGEEYKRQYSAQQQKFAYWLIDNGADLIIGHHPHVVQGIEEYKGKIIFYSLGNFIFDQYFSRPTEVGLGVEAVFEKGGIVYNLLPFWAKKSKPQLFAGGVKEGFLYSLAARSGKSIQKQIIKGKIVVKN